MSLLTRSVGSLFVLVSLLACSGTLTSPPAGDVVITVTNDGASTITALRIQTSENDSIPEIATLAAGATAGPFRVRQLHGAPFVRATANGRAYLAHPIEGFTGFNPALPIGTYVVKVRPHDESVLDVRVTAAP